ncbi:Polycomb protein esc-like Protein [Oopsacas minuta]|uniref:Polycomb protein esc-like Protein n=1 Tax=Oopsacas minuta TaxID=111878 RepID=A0AAV7JMV7_9METZ|nr:Polycomb protein esc-like Protein [Oopsacas minuta]
MDSLPTSSASDFELEDVTSSSFALPKFKYTKYIKEDHKKPIYCVQFNNHFGKDNQKILASVGSNRASIYDCTEVGSITPIQVYVDPNSDENFYSCVWTYTSEYESLLAIAGAKACIHILNVTNGKPYRSLLGHGDSINDLKFHTSKPEILFSASKDHSIRIWNIATVVCVAILAGMDGHRDEVLGVDINHDGSLLLSCGMDHAVKIWDLEEETLSEAIHARSYSHSPIDKVKSFNTLNVYSAKFSTRDIHTNYVDCVRWIGELVLSKSCENVIVCWKPDIFKKGSIITEQKALILYTYTVPNSTIWYIRFSMDMDFNILVAGNQIGNVFLYSLRVAKKPRAERLSHPACNSAVRQVCLSPDAKVLIVACDDSTIWRWDKL